MIDVYVVLPKSDDYDGLQSWFESQGVTLYGVIPNLTDVQNENGVAVVTMSITRQDDPRQWLIVSFTDDQKDLATLCKLTWCGQ